MLLCQVLDVLPVGSLACPTITGVQSHLSLKDAGQLTAQLGLALDISIPLLRDSR